jgi:hypothetical protein
MQAFVSGRSQQMQQRKVKRIARSFAAAAACRGDGHTFSEEVYVEHGVVAARLFLAGSSESICTPSLAAHNNW